MSLTPVHVTDGDGQVWTFASIQVATRFVEQAPVIEHNILRLIGADDVTFSPKPEPEAQKPRTRPKWRCDWPSFWLGWWMAAIAFLFGMVGR
jgi:hypothetical protein